MKIRVYKPKDFERVEEICGGPPRHGLLSRLMRGATLTVFCAYYVEQEPENCFVAVNDEDVAVGYILCAADFLTWERTFQARYLKQSKNLLARMMGKGTIEGLRQFSKEYPAHLHIDLHPDYQRMGLGSKLMDTLIAHLKAQGVPGIMLCVAADNTGARRFYEKYGFTVLEQKKHEIAMGVEISTWKKQGE